MRIQQLLPVVISALSLQAAAQVPDILLEACSLLDTPSKRIDCLKAANRHAASGSAGSSREQPQSLMAAPSFQSPARQSAAPSTSYGGGTCYVGPRGGTYTITKSGRKNYGGC